MEPNCAKCGQAVQWGTTPAQGYVKLDLQPAPTGRYFFNNDGHVRLWHPNAGWGVPRYDQHVCYEP